MKRLHFNLLVSFMVCIGGYAWAQAPVRDVSGDVRFVGSTAQSATEVQQTMNLLAYIDELQQELAVLRGQVEVLTRQTELLDQRQTQYYHDLDDRLRSQETGDVMAAVEENDPLQAYQSPPLIADNDFEPQLNEQGAYQQAYSQLMAQDYALAKQGFSAYLQVYEQGDYRPNAYYWLGEIALLNRETTQAVEHFSTILQDFPAHQKAGDALLKLGDAQAADGNAEAAREAYQRVINEQSHNQTLLHLAQARLDNLSP